MLRAAATLLITAILLSPVGAGAQPAKVAPPTEPEAQPAPNRDAGHRFGVDFSPYTSWGHFFGRIDSSVLGREKVDALRGALGVALHWEYNPIPYIGVGFKVDIELPTDKPGYLMVMPTLALRGILPLMRGRLELFIRAQVGATYLQYEDFVGYGYAVSGDLGVGYRITRRWGVQIHGGARIVQAWSGDSYLDRLGGQGAVAFFYLL